MDTPPITALVGDDDDGQTAPMPHRPLTIEEAASWLKVTRPTIHALINRGQLRRYKVGTATRIPAEDIFGLCGYGDNNARST